MPERPTPDLIGAEAAAHLLGIHSRTLRRWAREGRIPAVRLPSGRYKFWRADIEALLTPMPRDAA